MTELVVLLGHHIGYSASPAVHNAAFASLGIDARYDLADVSPNALADAVAALRAPDRIGANVTQPHKLAVCAFVDDLGPEVQRLGAANTIVRRDGRLVAHNTDLQAVAAELSAFGSVRSAVVLGTGGGSRAIQAALVDAGTEVTIVDRARWADLPRLIAGTDLLVNATPIGTGSSETPVSSEFLRSDLAVLDLVYRPSPSRLVREARAAGAIAHGGAGMLLRQAAASFALWTDREAPIGVMRDALAAELGSHVDA